MALHHFHIEQKRQAAQYHESDGDELYVETVEMADRGVVSGIAAGGHGGSWRGRRHQSGPYPPDNKPARKQL